MRIRRLGAMATMLAAALALVGCSSGGDGDRDGDDSKESATPKQVTPADVLAPITAAAHGAKSAAVTRTERSSDGKQITQEEIETLFAEPVSARVLHVGEEIWTLNVVEGQGYLKDQSKRKSNNRWVRLDRVNTAERLEHATLTGLLEDLEDATKVTGTAAGTVGGTDATCHSFALEQGSGDTARLCVDAQQRPVELTSTDGDSTTTTIFSAWGTPIDAIAPPAPLVD